MQLTTLSSTVNYDLAHSKVINKYLFKAFYNRINKNKDDLQIWLYNICVLNIIAIKNVIVVAVRDRKNGKSLIIENMDKTIITKIAKVLNIINFSNKDS